MATEWIPRPFDAQNFKCRCSSIAKALADSKQNPVATEKQLETIKSLEARTKPMTPDQQTEYARLITLRENSKKIILPDGYIEYLMEWYAWETEGMIPVGKESLDNLSMKHGKEAEKESIKLLSLYDGEFYMQHKERIFNDYLSGEVDCYLGNSIYEATNVTDIKNVEDYPSFLKKIHTGLANGQEEQLQGYGCITGAQDLFVANTVVTKSDTIIDEYRWKITKKMGALTPESPEVLAEWPKWERSMNFEKLSINKRVHKIKIEPFSDFKREKLYDRVKYGREFLHNFHEQRVKLG